MVKPVPPKEGIREIQFVGKSFPPGYREARLMMTMDFLQELDERLPLKANVHVLKHASPEMQDYETLIVIHPDPQVYAIINNGIDQPTWGIVGSVQKGK